MDQSLLISQVIDIARLAGQAIMQVYRTDFSQYEKGDGSPLTEADLAAHKIIVEGLASISDLPCLSEESDSDVMSWQTRGQWRSFWLVDPLDGTKEFINKSDEFTVNIALIEQGKAVLGVVYCPATDLLYFAADQFGAYKQQGEAAAEKIAVKKPVDKSWRIVGSRRHGLEALQQFSAHLANYDLISIGSSLKLCLVAEGKADLYPRLAPTCEWDTAAAQAIVEAAGGQVLGPDMQPLSYGQKADLLNPSFIVCSEINVLWQCSFAQLCCKLEQSS